MTKKDITIGLKVGGVFSSGQYENERVEPLISITYKDVEGIPEDIDEDVSQSLRAQEKLHSALYKQLAETERRSQQKAIQKIYTNFRWYPVGDRGESYPSVTSIINFANPIDYKIDENKLKGYGARGQVLDLLLTTYIETGEWLKPTEIAECYPYLAIMKANEIPLEGNLPAFVEKYGIKFLSGHKIVYNNEERYAGEYDCIVEFQSQKYMADLKAFYSSSGDDRQVNALKQIAAYARAENQEFVGGMIIPIHGKNQQGYSKPVITENLDEYWKMFLVDRAFFREKIGA